jgi:hypothetical protein
MSTESGAAPPRWRRSDGDHFGPVLAILIATLAVGAALPTRLASLAVAALGVALWIAVARAAEVRRQARLAGMVAFGVVVVGAIVAAATNSDLVQGLIDFVLAAAVAALAVVIGRALIRESVVTLSTVAGVLSLYLLIGLFFAQAYIGVFHLDDGAFIAVAPLGRFDLLYFSFIALTTVGFGDITPAIDLTRALAATEAVLGQLFLVTIVARVVSLIGQRPR